MLRLQDGAVNYGTLNCSFPLGNLITTATTVTNTATILIPGSGTMGPGAPYPSSLTVSGITGTVSKVTVTVMGLAHDYPSDIDLLLVGPTGTNVLLMSNCSSGPITNVNLTFDDNAPDYVGDSGQITSGTYLPTGHGSIFENFYPPAPAGPLGLTLSAFIGLNPHGTWSLYAQDVAAEDTGEIAQGWQININTSDLVCCTGAPPPPPLIQSLSLSNNLATVTWNSITGQTYRLQYNTNLNSAAWTTIPPDVTATNFTISRSNSLFPGTQCFYRVLIVP